MRLIYGLIDPRTQLIRYVGKSMRGLSRPKAHKYLYGRTGATHCGRWIRQLQASNLSYDICVLEEVEASHDLAEAERWWIAYGHASGWPLTNLTDGGEGTPGHVQSEATRGKIGAGNKGKKRTAATRALMRAVASNRSPETLKKIGEASARLPKATRERIAAALRGRPGTPHTEEFKRKAKYVRTRTWVAINFCALLRGDALPRVS